MSLPLHTVELVPGSTPPSKSDRLSFGMLTGIATPLAAAVAATGNIAFTVNPVLAAAATGSVTFTTNPANTNTITIGGTSVEFVTSGATGNQVNIVSGNAAGTIAALLTFLQGSSDTNLVKFTYATSGAGLVLNLTAASAGTAGNSLTFSTTVSGTTLSNSGTLSGGIATNIVTIGGTAVTFVSSGATGNQANIGGTLAVTLGNLLAVLQASSDTNLVKFAYGVASGTTLDLTAAIAGTAGNSLTFSTNVSGATSSNSGTMSGGLAVGAAGQGVSVAVSGLSFPADYNVVGTPNQDAVVFVSSKSSSGFTVNVNPRIASEALVAGTVDLVVFH